MEERMVSNAAWLVQSYPALHFFVRLVVPLNGSVAAAADADADRKTALSLYELRTTWLFCVIHERKGGNKKKACWALPALAMSQPPSGYVELARNSFFGTYPRLKCLAIFNNVSAVVVNDARLPRLMPRWRIFLFAVTVGRWSITGQCGGNYYLLLGDLSMTTRLSSTVTDLCM